uniref:Basic helix-loop-helix protein A isoform X2 n=1 Tax=Cicer arietinum TaxID=3827 RepID=A0A3Q7YAT7_CICAR|nr:basic helix-loop-helix protein A isoform X2 [Cicer arietinum]
MSMAAPPVGNKLQNMLQAAVQSVQWTYSLFWQLCPQQLLPGKAYTRRQHVWLTGANEVDSKTFSRAILAKIPTIMYTMADPPSTNLNQDDMDEDDEEEEEEEDEDEESGSEDETGGRNRRATSMTTGMTEPSELMQIEMPEDIRVGSPNDGSNNLDSNFHLLAVSNQGNPPGQVESIQRWGPIEDPMGNSQHLQLSSSVLHQPLEELRQQDTHYSQTVSNILQNNSTQSPSINFITYSTHSSFTITNSTNHHFHAPPPDSATSQWLLKYILFTVPYLHTKNHDETSPQTRDTTGTDPSSRLRTKGTPQDELSANHVLAERRRREKLNERFIILRSLVPFVTKMDKASILGDTIEYLKQLRRKIQDLETRNRQIETEQQQTKKNGVTVMVGPSEKKKMRIVEECGATRAKAVEVVETVIVTSVQVSIIESDALLEIECPQREGLLLDVMQMLREMRIEVIGVQSSLNNNNGVFVAELRAKVKDNGNGKKVSIVEVKRALNQIIPHANY